MDVWSIFVLIVAIGWVIQASIWARNVSSRLRAIQATLDRMEKRQPVARADVPTTSHVQAKPIDIEPFVD
jgi:hypothetical protein